jgi:DNA-binding GntR family transcriptional regulator
MSIFEGRDGPNASLLSEQVKDFVVGRILSGDLQPGDRVVESALAREFGISQAPVRDAVRDLVMMGYLETEPHKGTWVRSLSPEEQYEVYVVRGALESLAARIAAARITSDDAETLRNILYEMIDAGRRQDLNGMTRADNEFHETVLKIAGNRLLHQLWQRLFFGYWTLATARREREDLEYLAKRHEELLDALCSREPEAAAEAMRHHIEDLGKPLIDPEPTPILDPVPQKTGEN